MKKTILLLAVIIFASLPSFAQDPNEGHIIAIRGETKESDHSALVILPVLGADIGYRQIVSAHATLFVGNGRLNKYLDGAEGSSISDVGIYEIDVTGAMADLELGCEGIRASLGLFQMSGFTLFWIVPVYGHQGLSFSYSKSWKDNNSNYLGINYELGIMNMVRMNLGIEKDIDSFGNGNSFDAIRPRLSIGVSIPVGLFIGEIRERD